MKKLSVIATRLFLTAPLIFGLICIAFAVNAAPKPAATIYYNGTVVTVDENMTYADAVAVDEDGIIVAVGKMGDVLRQSGPKTTKINLQGKTLLPGFYDPHGHFGGSYWRWAQCGSGPFGPVTSLASMKQVMKDWAVANPTGTIMGYGYDDIFMCAPDSSCSIHPYVGDMNEVSTTRPVMAVHFSGHLIVVNDYVLDNSAIRQNPGSIPASMWAFIGKDSNGNLNGHIYGNAQYYIYGFVPTYTYTQQLEDIAHYSSTYAAVGTTTANNGGTGAASVLDLFKAAADGDYLKIRANLWFSRTGAKTVHDAYGTDVAGASRELPKYAGKNNLVVVNGVKFLADGSPQLRTAYLTDQYKTPGSYPEGWAGAPYYATYSLLQNDVVAAHQDGFDQIHIHGNGDAAIDWILNAYEEVRLPQYRQSNSLRHTVIHSQFQREDQIDRMSAMKVIPSFFPLHTYYLGDRHMDIFLGNERSWRMSACQDAVDRGMRFTIHSDSPVMAHNPLLVMWSAVNRISYGNRPVYTPHLSGRDKIPFGRSANRSARRASGNDHLRGLPGK